MSIRPSSIPSFINYTGKRLNSEYLGNDKFVYEYVRQSSHRVNIIDTTEPPAYPTLSFSNTPTDITEGGTATFTVKAADPKMGLPVDAKINVTQAGDFAESGQTGTRTITVPESGTATFKVRTDDDSTHEADGSITATILADNNSPTKYDVGAVPARTVNVADNDPAPPQQTEIRWSKTEFEGSEASGAVQPLIKSNAPFPAGTVIPVTITPGTARPGRDYTPHNNGAVFGRFGNTTGLLSIKIVGDRVQEPTETFYIEIDTANLPANTVVTGPARVPIHIIDDDPPAHHIVTITAPADVDEGHPVTFSFNGPSDLTADIHIRVTSNPADDAKAATCRGDHTIRMVNGSVDWTCNTTGTDRIDGDATITVELYSDTAREYHVGTPKTGSVIVKDTSVSPRVWLSLAHKEVPETGLSFLFYVNSNVAPTTDMTIGYTVTRVAGVGDHTLDEPEENDNCDTGRNEIVIPAGVKRVSGGCRIVDDDVYTGPRDIEFRIVSVSDSNYLISPDSGRAFVIRITDDESAPQDFNVSLSAPAEVNEGDRVKVTATLSQPSPGTMDIPLKVLGHRSTVEPSDYGGIGSIRIAKGGTTGSVDIQTNRDADDDHEILSIGIRAESLIHGLAIGDPADVDVKIVDPSAAPLPFVVNFALGERSFNVAEGSSISFDVVAAPAPDQDTTIPLTYAPVHAHSAVENVDYIPVSAIELAKGQTTAELRISILDNDIGDVDRGFVVSIDRDNAPSHVTCVSDCGRTVTIEDDEDPSVTISADKSTATEGDGVRFTVVASRPVTANVKVNVQDASGSDFLAIGDEGGRSSPVDADGWIFDVVTVDDTTDESNGHFTASILPGDGWTLGSPSTVSVLVRDNEAPEVNLRSPSEVVEGQAATVTAVLNDPLTSDVTIPLRVTGNGTAESDDYGPIGSIRIPRGQTSGTLRIQTREDADTDNELLVLAIREPLSHGLVAGSSNTASIPIRDNDEKETTPPPPPPVNNDPPVMTVQRHAEGQEGGTRSTLW